MVVATSGKLSPLCFNRIVSSNTHPYHVFTSETLSYSPAVPGTDVLCGLYIKDLNFANALIRYNNPIYKVKLAKINFQTQRITSKVVFS